MNSTLALAGFLLAGAATVLGFAGLAHLAEALPDGGSIAPLLPLFLVLMIPAAVGAWLLPYVRAEGATFLVVLLVAAGARAMFLPVEPGLSDDVYRYLWDGRVQAAGMNPYGVAPEDPSLDRIESDWATADRVRGRINHPEIPTVYPPFSQVLFAGVASLAGGVATWKALLLIAELLLALLIVRALEHFGRDPRWVLLYLWHPLPVVEIAWNAHAELLGVLPFLWCIVLLLEERKALAGVALGGAIAAKLMPIGFGLALLRRGGLVAGFLAVGTVVWLSLPFVGVDPRSATRGLGEYAGSWYFNDLVFRPLGALLGIDPEDRTDPGTRALRIGLVAVWGLIALKTSGLKPVSAGFWLVGSFILLSPTVHPWYLLWVLPFAVIQGSHAWWLLAGTTLIAYDVRISWEATGVWEESAATRWIVYGAPIALMVWHRAEEWRSRRSRTDLEDSPERPVSPGESS